MVRFGSPPPLARLTCVCRHTDSLFYSVPERRSFERVKHEPIRSTHRCRSRRPYRGNGGERSHDHTGSRWLGLPEPEPVPELVGGLRRERRHLLAQRQSNPAHVRMGRTYELADDRVFQELTRVGHDHGHKNHTFSDSWTNSPSGSPFVSQQGIAWSAVTPTTLQAPGSGQTLSGYNSQYRGVLTIAAGTYTLTQTYVFDKPVQDGFGSYNGALTSTCTFTVVPDKSGRGFRESPGADEVGTLGVASRHNRNRGVSGDPFLLQGWMVKRDSESTTPLKL